MKSPVTPEVSLQNLLLSVMGNIYSISQILNVSLVHRKKKKASM